MNLVVYGLIYHSEHSITCQYRSDPRIDSKDDEYDTYVRGLRLHAVTPPPPPTTQNTLYTGICVLYIIYRPYRPCWWLPCVDIEAIVEDCHKPHPPSCFTDQWRALKEGNVHYII